MKNNKKSCDDNNVDFRSMPLSEFAEKYIGLELLPYQKKFIDYYQTIPNEKIVFARQSPPLINNLEMLCIIAEFMRRRIAKMSKDKE